MTVPKKVKKRIDVYNEKVKHRISRIDVNIVGQEKAVVPLWDLLQIGGTPLKIVQGMAAVPSNYAYWAFIRETIDDEIVDRNYDYDVWHAEKYEDIVKAYGPKSTEAYRGAMITRTYGKEQKKMLAQLAILKSSVRKVKVILKSLEFKKDMLQSIGAMYRSEMDISKLNDAIFTSKETGKKRL